MPKGLAAKKMRDSQAALVCAEAFQRLAEEFLPRIGAIKTGVLSLSASNEVGDLVACATNLAFAQELYLKALLTHFGLPVPENHDLRALYDGIPQPVRELIESVYDVALLDTLRRLPGWGSFQIAKGPLEEPRWDDDKKESPALPDLLARSRDLFQTWRYAFEFSPPADGSYQFHRFDYAPLRCAAEAMRVELTVRLRGTGEIGETPCQ